MLEFPLNRNIEDDEQQDSESNLLPQSSEKGWLRRREDGKMFDSVLISQSQLTEGKMFSFCHHTANVITCKKHEKNNRFGENLAHYENQLSVKLSTLFISPNLFHLIFFYF